MFSEDEESCTGVYCPIKKNCERYTVYADEIKLVIGAAYDKKKKKCSNFKKGKSWVKTKKTK